MIFHLFSLVLWSGTALALAASAPLQPYKFNPASPADLSGIWQVDSAKSNSLYTHITNPAERAFEATMVYGGATAREVVGDVTIAIYPIIRPNSKTMLYGNLRTGAYWYPGYKCTGKFMQNPDTKMVVEWIGACGKGTANQTIPLRLVRK